MTDPRDIYSSSQRGTIPGYVVEARYYGNGPYAKVGDQTFAKEWSQIAFNRALVGVPNNIYNTHADEAGLLTYPAALALMAWAEASGHIATCVEYRLVKLELVYSWERRTKGTGEAKRFWDDERAAKYEPLPTPAGRVSPNGERE